MPERNPRIEDKGCSHPGCDKTYRPHRWGKTKTHPDWFHQKDGNSWCPDHHPEWVAEWREKRQNPEPNDVTFSQGEKW